MTHAAIIPFPDAPAPYNQPYATPLMNASGTWHPELPDAMPDALIGMGAILLKTATLHPKGGNPQPRSLDLGPIGMLNSIGLQNPGIDVVLDHALPKALSWHRPVWVSFSAETPEDWQMLAEKLAKHPRVSEIAALELNTSCPNIDQQSGFSSDFFKATMSGVKIFRDMFPHMPLMTKISPAEFGLTGMMILAEQAMEQGATGITAINGMVGLAINPQTGKPHLMRNTGGYSGPGILPIVLASVWRLRQRFPLIPIAGSGGIRHGRDVQAMQAAGATLIQVGCATFANPTLFKSLSGIT